MTALLSPLWRDEAGARLLIAGIEDLVTNPAEKTGRAAEEGEMEESAEEDPEQVSGTGGELGGGRGERGPVSFGFWASQW